MRTRQDSNNEETLHKKIDELSKENYQLKFIVHNIPGNVYWKNKKGIYMGCNNNLAEIVKMKNCDDVIGTTTYTFIDKEIADKVVKIDEELMRLDKELLTEEIGLNKEGNTAIYLTKKVPLHDKDGNVVGLLGTSIDITDRKRAEQLQKEKEIVFEKLALTEAFAGFLAHEMRTPIAALNLDLDTIIGNEKNQNAEEKQKNLYQIIAKGKQTIKEANIFIDMLLLKLRSMGKKVKQEDLNPCLVLEDVNDALALYPFTETERTQVILDEKDAFIYLGDSLHTQHIILNLLKNALKIIREEGKGEIHITFEQDEDCNKLIFTDTAKGIAQEFLPSIFDAFITKDDTKKGTGLGLAYCKIIMHGYGGDITCESKLGEYTKFILTFPKINMADLA